MKRILKTIGNMSLGLVNTLLFVVWFTFSAVKKVFKAVKRIPGVVKRIWIKMLGSRFMEFLVTIIFATLFSGGLIFSMAILAPVYAKIFNMTGKEFNTSYAIGITFIHTTALLYAFKTLIIGLVKRYKGKPGTVSTLIYKSACMWIDVFRRYNEWLTKIEKNDLFLFVKPVIKFPLRQLIKAFHVDDDVE